MSLLILITNVVSGQSQIEVKITIDIDCECTDSLSTKSIGKFGIYTYTAIPWSDGDHKYDLLEEIEIKAEQRLTLQQGTYKLIFTPADSSQQKNQFYFALSQYATQIHLNCFFFNKNYPSLLGQLNKKDTIVMSSTYHGNTNDETIIPTHTVVIFKKNKKYYASYYKSEQSGPQIAIQPFSHQQPKFDPQISLSEKQVQQFIEFEEDLLNRSINDNLNYEVNSKNNIWISGKKISFYSKEYITLLLWNELNKTTANKK